MELVVAETHMVPAGAERRRLDIVAWEAFEAYPTRSSSKKACRRGEIALDGLVAEGSRFVEAGQRVDRLLGKPPDIAGMYRLTVAIHYEDPWLAVVFKPPGLRVNGNQHKTLERTLPFNLAPSAEPDAITPRVCHRLDAKTSGLLVVAKSRRALVGVSKAFMERRVEKRYRAIIIGRLDGEGLENGPIDDRDAHTTWKALSHTRCLKSEWVTTVDLRPRTGRKHQLRIHMARLGHPVLGDVPHGREGLILRGKGLFLCAIALSFEHPVTGERIDLAVPPPDKFETWRLREERRWARYHPPTELNGGSF